jgi:hypothetical protein
MVVLLAIAGWSGRGSVAAAGVIADAGSPLNQIV